MNSIAVDDSGITVVQVTEPLISMYGKQMRPSVVSTIEIPWEEIASVGLYSFDLEPDGEAMITMDIDLTYGEFITVHEDAKGFAEAVALLSTRAGRSTPERVSISSVSVDIWP